MKIKWLLAILILIVFISGCIGDEEEIEPEFKDNALKMEVRIREKEENRRILPGQTIRMTVTLTNQVEDETDSVDLKIIDPYGIQISKVDCGNDCICEWVENPSGPNIDVQKDCNRGKCYYNGCYYNSIQSLDEVEITYGLKIPSEEEISAMGRDLEPKIMLEYYYSGTSALYVPIYKYEEKPVEPKKEFTQTTGPIHVDIDSDNWVRAGDLFPIYVDVKDVVHSSEKPIMDTFTMTIDHAYINEGLYGRCDFIKNNYYTPKEEIELPLINPLVCTLKAEEQPTAPMVKASIIIDYSYTYKVEKTETIRVEKAFLGIF
jgi:hypothetical protein